MTDSAKESSTKPSPLSTLERLSIRRELLLTTLSWAKSGKKMEELEAFLEAVAKQRTEGTQQKTGDKTPEEKVRELISTAKTLGGIALVSDGLLILGGISMGVGFGCHGSFAPQGSIANMHAGDYALLIATTLLLIVALTKALGALGTMCSTGTLDLDIERQTNNLGKTTSRS